MQMNKKQQDIVIGCLLHDFGKLLYRYNDGRNHSTSGYEYLKELISLNKESDILDCVRYHHGAALKNAAVDDNAVCYIAYIADNIAASVDRRSKETDEGGFVKDIASESIFNILNGNDQKMIYLPEVLSEDGEINFPTDENINFTDYFYGKIVSDIRNSLEGIEFTDSYIDSLLRVLEANLIFVPSSTQTGELRDISLYDHLKLTAAFGSCIGQYLDENNISDYKNALFKNAESFYDKKIFRIYSIDLSGIQDFIYNISSKGALKGLRSRSFYLEMLMENAVDELLSRAALSRANVIYTGGGHTYIIMSATEKTNEVIKKFESELNQWFIDTFGNALYSAGGYCDCSARELKNVPEGSYREIFAEISRMISKKKLHRYSAEEILKLNAAKSYEHSRECIICHRSDMLDEENKCSICSGLEKLSDHIIDSIDKFFTVHKKENYDGYVPLPFGCCLTAYTSKQLTKIMKDDPTYVRSYSKNKLCTGYELSSNLWVGDYAAEKEFSQLVKNAGGIDRLAVIRADVDNLGQTFVNGFTQTDGGKYETISRTAAFSRKMSEFFKLNINNILENGEFQLFTDKDNKERNAVIVYSGGDDVFAVGGWDDIICFGIDLYNTFKRYTQGTVTISAGIGIYPEKFPVSVMAEQTGKLEDVSKNYNNGSKNAVTLFDKDNCYSWQELIDEVIGEKLRTLQSYISGNGVHAKAMLYKMLELIREREKEDRLNIARFAYLLARLKPDDEKATSEEKTLYNDFSKKMYRWIQDEKDCRQLVTAIYIYVYMNRESEENRYEKT